jgi:hypothetical protein
MTNHDAASEYRKRLLERAAVLADIADWSLDPEERAYWLQRMLEVAAELVDLTHEFTSDK